MSAFADKLLSVFDHFVGLAFKGLRNYFANQEQENFSYVPQICKELIEDLGRKHVSLVVI